MKALRGRIKETKRKLYVVRQGDHPVLTTEKKSFAFDFAEHRESFGESVVIEKLVYVTPLRNRK